MDDAQRVELVRRAAAGDGDALQRLLVVYHAMLRARLAQEVGTEFARHIDVEDALQEAYISAFEAIRRPPLANQSCDREGADARAADLRGRAADPSLADGRGPRSHAPLTDVRGPAADAPLTDVRRSERGEIRSAPHFDSPAAFYKWIEQIALHDLRDMQRGLRRQKRDVGRLATPGDVTGSVADLVERFAGQDPTPSRRLAREELVAAALTCLARLTDEQRLVICRRYFEHASVAAVAAELGTSEPAVHALCYRAIQALRGHLGSISRYLTGL